MIDEKKPEELVTVGTQEVARGDRGVVGEASNADKLKQEWHEANFKLVDVSDKINPRRQAWAMKAGAPSLKRWAKQQAAAGNQLAKDWFANKAGAKNEVRSDKNIKRIYEEKIASKAARRKAGQAKQNKPKDAAAAPAAK